MVFMRIKTMNNSELTDMLDVYFKCDRNSNRAVQLYIARFPDREVPDRRKFSRLEYNLRNYGCFKKPKLEQRHFNENVELSVLLSVQENSRTSTREIGSNLNTSKDTVQKILKKHKFKPYVSQKVHALEENDHARRIQFCRFYLDMVQHDPTFYSKIIWSDESTFSNNGIYNRNIHRYWSQENPRVIVETNFQRRFSVNVWCGVFGKKLIGPFFIDGTLTSEKYNRLLTENLENFLDELPLAELNGIYFQQDGAPPHNARINLNWVNYKFGANWFGTHGPVRWPARSPDLTPLDFWLWGYLKDQVYTVHPENENILRQRIIEVCREIPENVLINATYGVIRRCELCIRQGGGQFEHYL